MYVNFGSTSLCLWACGAKSRTDGIGVLGVVHVPSFFKELETLKGKGVNTTDRVLISDRGEFDLPSISSKTLLCHLIRPRGRIRN